MQSFYINFDGKNASLTEFKQNSAIAPSGMKAKPCNQSRKPSNLRKQHNIIIRLVLINRVGAKVGHFPRSRVHL